MSVYRHCRRLEAGCGRGGGGVDRGRVEAVHSSSGLFAERRVDIETQAEVEREMVVEAVVVLDEGAHVVLMVVGAGVLVVLPGGRQAKVETGEVAAEGDGGSAGARGNEVCAEVIGAGSVAIVEDAEAILATVEANLQRMAAEDLHDVGEYLVARGRIERGGVIAEGIVGRGRSAAASNGGGGGEDHAGKLGQQTGGGKGARESHRVSAVRLSRSSVDLVEVSPIEPGVDDRSRIESEHVIERGAEVFAQQRDSGRAVPEDSCG